MLNRGLAFSGRPGDLQELFTHAKKVGFDRAFSEFLDEFYVAPVQAALDVPAPADQPAETRAFLAAACEELAREWGFKIPDWVHAEVLPSPIVWEIHRGILPAESAAKVAAIVGKLTPPTFRRHGILVRASVLTRF